MKVTRNSPGNYTVLTAGNREWTVTRNPQLGETPWVAYETGKRDTVLDPLWTLRETLQILQWIENRELSARYSNVTL